MWTSALTQNLRSVQPHKTPSHLQPVSWGHHPVAISLAQSCLLWPISKAIFPQAALLPTCSAQDLSQGQLTWMGQEDSKLSTSKPENNC